MFEKKEISNGVNIIIGLGNPESKYKNTPHNIGFEVIDKIAKEKDFPEFRLAKKFKALISEKDEIILVKPETFMNLSGQSVKAIKSFYKTENILVIHDDIDLILGSFKVSRNSGSAGHRGIESIIKELGTKDFERIRVGVQPEKGKPKEVEKYVLKKFVKKQREVLKPTILEIMETLEIKFQNNKNNKK